LDIGSATPTLASESLDTRSSRPICRIGGEVCAAALEQASTEPRRTVLFISDLGSARRAKLGLAQFECAGFSADVRIIPHWHPFVKHEGMPTKQMRVA